MSDFGEKLGSEHMGTAALGGPAEQSSMMSHIPSPHLFVTVRSGEPALILSTDWPMSQSRYAAWLRHVAATLASALREIFDESAYVRFLARQGVGSCPRTYAAFLREQEGVKACRPKCC